MILAHARQRRSRAPERSRGPRGLKIIDFPLLLQIVLKKPFYSLRKTIGHDPSPWGGRRRCDAGPYIHTRTKLRLKRHVGCGMGPGPRNPAASSHSPILHPTCFTRQSIPGGLIQTPGGLVKGDSGAIPGLFWVMEITLCVCQLRHPTRST